MVPFAWLKLDDESEISEDQYSGDESNRSRYWVSGEAHADSRVWLWKKKKKNNEGKKKTESKEEQKNPQVNKWRVMSVSHPLCWARLSIV